MSGEVARRSGPQRARNRRQGGRSGRRRSETARRRVLEAGYAILCEDSLSKFTIEAVAARSGVARTTIYRWWPSKPALASDSLLEFFRPQIDYRHDAVPEHALRALITSIARAFDGPDGRVVASVLAEAQSDPEAQRLFRESFSAPFRAESTQILTDAVASGALRADLNVQRLIDAFAGAAYYRLILGQPLNEQWARETSDTLLQGALPR